MRLEQGQYTNIYRAVVINNFDPMEIGRVQVRVPFLHGIQGSSSYIEDKFLPYALPCFPSAGHDSGMFLVPEVGTMVFIMFENGDSTKPIYLGQMPSKGAQETQYLGYTNSEIYKKSKSKMKLVDIDDTPRGAYDLGAVRRFVLFKTTKGASIQFNDSDEKETLEVTDRLGQIFMMHSPTSVDDNEGGWKNRGLFSILKQKFKDRLFKPAIIILKAISGSFLRFVSDNDYSKTELINVYKDEEVGISIDIGVNNRIIVFYKDSKIEMKEDQINIKSKQVNIEGDTINFKGNWINTTSDIHVGSVGPTNIKDYKNTNDEHNIEDLYELAQDFYGDDENREE